MRPQRVSSRLEVGTWRVPVGLGMEGPGVEELVFLVSVGGGLQGKGPRGRGEGLAGALGR